MTSSDYSHEKRVLAKLIAAGFRASVVYNIGPSPAIWVESISDLLPLAEFHLFDPSGGDPELDAIIERVPNLHLHRLAGAQERVDDYASSKRLPQPDIVRIEWLGDDQKILEGLRTALRSAKVLLIRT